jgi:hypothetical protein
MNTIYQKVTKDKLILVGEITNPLLFMIWTKACKYFQFCLYKIKTLFMEKLIKGVKILFISF